MQFSAITQLLAGLLGCCLAGTAVGNEEQGMTFGVCVIAPMNTNAIHSVAFSLDVNLPELWVQALPNDVLRELNTGYPSAEALDRLFQWERNLKVKVISKPNNGSIFSENRGYRQNNNFIGKDKVELLIEGKDKYGKPTSAKLIYFINIVPWKEYDGLTYTKYSYSRHLKKYCGKTRGRWRISS